LDRRLEPALGVAVREARIFVKEIRHPVGVRPRRLVVEEEIGELYLVIVGEDAQGVIVEPDVVRASFDIEVLVEQPLERGRGHGDAEVVLLRCLEDRTKAIDILAELLLAHVARLEGGLGLLHLPLEPVQDRGRAEPPDALGERPLVVRAIHEPDALFFTHVPSSVACRSPLARTSNNPRSGRRKHFSTAAPARAGWLPLQRTSSSPAGSTGLPQRYLTLGEKALSLRAHHARTAAASGHGSPSSASVAISSSSPGASPASGGSGPVSFSRSRSTPVISDSAPPARRATLGASM